MQVADSHSLIRRIVEAAEIDTVVDTRLIVDSVATSAARAHENNVIGTMNILAACGGPNSSVRKLVFKSSAHYYGCHQDDPAFFTEDMERPHPPRTPLERDILEAEAAVADFAEKNPDVSVTILRFANVLGSSVKTSHTALFDLPAVPMVLGFDPRYQFVHEDDVVGALEHVLNQSLPGVFNVAADGVLALTEVIDLLGKRIAPVLPPWGTGLAAAALRRAGVVISPEMLTQLRFGRGLDNRLLKATGFRYRYTTRETVLKLAEHMRLAPILRGAAAPYRYEREVEEFLRRSPNVRRSGRRPPERADGHGVLPERTGEAHAADRGDGSAELGGASAGYEDLEAGELAVLLGSLETDDLIALREHERTAHRRPDVLAAIDDALGRAEPAGPDEP